MINENLDKKLSVEQYIEKTGVSIETFNQFCKAETGFTAKQLLLDVKITEAKMLRIIFL
ncbi:hypothetical protein [Empedobacter brevis]|uniref:hypothetical protein n=1 Tax=Empedobacter brevis TaxID=247 RepID=UPI0039AF3BD8